MVTAVSGRFFSATLSFFAIATLLTLSLSRPVANKALQIPVAYRAVGKYACLSDNECPVGQFCDPAGGRLREFGECKPLVKENGKCFRSNDRDEWIWLDESEGGYQNHNCEAGLYCTQTDICRPPSGLGKSCEQNMAHSCESGTYCDETSKTCKKKGSQGSSCQRTYNTYRNTVHNPCADSLGLYCKRTKEDSVPVIVPGTCVRKVTGGETSDAGACSGFLIKVGKNATSACMPHRLEGQPCRKNTQCRGEMRAGSTRSDTICNWVDKEMGLLPRYGVCAKERDLIRTVGAPCTPGLDLCDARRDLRCEKRGGKHVCVQNGGFIPHGHTHCTPRSMFSKCPGQVCRQLTETISEVPFGPFLCLSATESLKQGEICSSAEHTHCGKGLECVTVDGLQEDFPIQTAYCMLRVNEGEECSQWHRTTCGEGTSCITGKCDKSNDQPSLVAMSFSGKDAPCLKVPCAPGMICSKSRKRCELPEKVVELGSVCGASSPVYKVCGDNAECDDRGGHRERLCRKKSDTEGVAGASCYASCGKGLECSQKMVLSLFSDVQRYCYNKTASLKIGDTCNKDESDVDDITRNPNIGSSFPKCYIPAEEFEHPLKCLPKGKDLVCQKEARLFGHCSAKDNIVCEKGLACSPTMSICLGKDEM